MGDDGVLIAAIVVTETVKSDRLWMYLEGIDLTAQGCVCLGGGRKAGERGEGQILCVPSQGVWISSSGKRLPLINFKLTSHISYFILER